jgi:hypothetical protein
MRPDNSRRALTEGLLRRRDEIGRAIATRAHAIEPPGHDADPEYLAGLRAAIEAAIDHTIEASADAGDPSVAVPTPILSQARLAAREGVPLETMLRRYLAGHAVLGDFVVEEAGRLNVPPNVLRVALRAQAARTDQALMVIGAAYAAEVSAVQEPTGERSKADRVRRLLDSELVDPSLLEYGLERWHLGIVGQGIGADRAIREAIARFDAQRLIVVPDEEVVWAWLGMRTALDPGRLAAALPRGPSSEACIAIGEPAEGLAGWRLTHRQARAALPVAQRGSDRTVRYRDVALLAVAIKDELFTTSLTRLYIAPLAGGRDGGRAVRDTLRVFLDAQQNVTSAAATLGVSRQTVSNRLRTAEQRLGRPLHSCSYELKAALRLSEVDEVAPR